MVSGGDVTGHDDTAVAAKTPEGQEEKSDNVKDETQVLSKNQQKKLARKLARKERCGTPWIRHETVWITHENGL